MADTQPLAPTDAEIAALRSEFGITSNGRGIKEFTQVRDFARAVLAKWGTPTAGEPVAWLSPWRADQVTTDYDAYGEHGIALYTAPQADSQPAPVSANHADLPPLPDPDMRDVGTTPGGVKEFLRGYATEYAKAALAARAPADSMTAPAAGAVAHTLSDAQIEAMPVWRNFVGLWPESRREIVDAVVDLLAAAPTTQPAPQQEPDEISSYIAARAWVARAAQEGK